MAELSLPLWPRPHAGSQVSLTNGPVLFKLNTGSARHVSGTTPSVLPHVTAQPHKVGAAMSIL